MDETIKAEVDTAIQVVCNMIKNEDIYFQGFDSVLPETISALAELIAARASLD